MGRIPSRCISPAHDFLCRPSSRAVRQDSNCGAALGYNGSEADSCASLQDSQTVSQTGRHSGRRLDSIPFDTDDEGDSTSGSSIGVSVGLSDGQTGKPSAAAAHNDSLGRSDCCAREDSIQCQTCQTVKQHSWQRRFVQSWWFPQCVLLACQVRWRQKIII